MAIAIIYMKEKKEATPHDINTLNSHSNTSGIQDRTLISEENIQPSKQAYKEKVLTRSPVSNQEGSILEQDLFGNNVLFVEPTDEEFILTHVVSDWSIMTIEENDKQLGVNGCKVSDNHFVYMQTPIGVLIQTQMKQIKKYAVCTYNQESGYYLMFVDTPPLNLVQSLEQLM